MSKKLFTFLGTFDYEAMVYYFDKDRECDGKLEDLKTRFVQIPLCKKLGYDIEVITFLTPEARKANWVSNGEKMGLEDILRKEKIKFKAVDIKNGKDTEELWNNFDRIFEQFDQEDEVYVDITYSLRSIPIIFMSLLSYARVVKKINIKGIYYGAFEVSEIRNIENEKLKLAPIFDLTFFNRIEDWTKGSEKFLTTGDSRILAEEILSTSNLLNRNLSSSEKDEVFLMENISEMLKVYSEDLLVCRGKRIVPDCKRLKDEINKIKKIKIADFSPFSKIINQICDSLEMYNGDVINDSIHAIIQSKKFRLLQQAYTMLQETLITYITISLNLNYRTRNDRRSAEKIMKSFLYDDVDLKAKQEQLKNKCNKKIMMEVGKLYEKVGELRNDLNHDGFSYTAKNYSNFENELDGFIEKFNEIIKNSYNPQKHGDIKRNTVSIISHKLLDSQVCELKKDWNVDNILELPEVLKKEWSNINTNEELEKNLKIVNKFKKFILANTNQEDYVIVQGEWGMTFTVVNMCFELNRVPIYATTERKTKETVIDGQVHSEKVFEHVRFRKYRM